MYSITKNGNNISSSSVREFIADTLDDINNLPHIACEGVKQSNCTVSNDCVLAGSTCICIETGGVFILGNDDVWHEL